MEAKRTPCSATVGTAVVRPILQQAYRPSHATDIRQSFELERQRLGTYERDDLATQFAANLGRVLVGLAKSMQGPRRSQGTRP